MLKTIDFSTYSSIKIGGKIDVKIINKIQDYSDYTIIGGANNILLSPHPLKLAMLGKNFDFIEKKDDLLHIGGTTPSGKILSYAKKYNLANFELMQKLPGTLGGMVKMNAGLKEWEIFNHLVAIKTQTGWIKKEDIDFGYRFANIKEIIFEAVFEASNDFDFKLLEMFKKLRDNQPNFPSAGSCFKNPKGNFAGKLLDEVGLKGYKIGNMSFSGSHANFLINLGGGTFDDAITLINEAKKRVMKKFNIKLELEIKILGH
ncbi:MAG: UDP-N-acetylmuramate dehydrogenase [Campylobacteraceae bacterium]|nr:UDP-N-acetylmuramate dehydrogenase [Campylobacteraceae bacterium]